jgi:hypothetical protein
MPHIGFKFESIGENFNNEFFVYHIKLTIVGFLKEPLFQEFDMDIIFSNPCTYFPYIAYNKFVKKSIFIRENR